MPEPKRDTLVTTYPGKAIWTLCAVAFNAVKLPFWLLLYVVPAARPNPKWTYRQALRMQILTNFLWNFAFVEARTPLTTKPGWTGAKWAVVPPAAKQYLRGPVTKDPEIVPLETGGTWYPAKLDSANNVGTYVVMHLHGGAFIMGDGRPADAGYAASKLLHNTTATHVFAPQYRLANNPGGRFPAALQDAIACYLHLLYTVGIPPQKIVLSGDSAGANLVIAMLRYIDEFGQETGLPKPRAAWLHSPWVDPKTSFKSHDTFNKAPNRHTDYINAQFGTWGCECYAPDQSTGLTVADPYVSPMEHPFKLGVPTWISAGECEVLLHNQIRMYEEFQTLKENVLELSIEPNSPHDIILTGRYNCFHTEAANACKKAEKFLQLHS